MPSRNAESGGAGGVTIGMDPVSPGVVSAAASTTQLDAATALAAERALEKLELDLQQRLATVFQRYQTAAAQVERYRQAILPDTRENLDLVGKAYHAGEYDYLQMLVALRTFSTTNLAYLEAMQELRVAALEIDGLLLSGSLGAGK